MTARYLSIRPSLPHVQAERDQSIRQSRQRRAEAKLVKAAAAAPSAGTAENGVDDLVGFARWYASFRNAGLLAGLAGHEEAQFRALAMEAFRGRAAPARWAAALAALRDRQKEAAAALEAAYWRQQSRHRWSTSHGDWV
jgi:hypothetical protein